MAVLPAVPGVIKADLLFSVGTDANAHSHLFFKTDTGTHTNTQLQSFATKISAAWSAQMVDKHMNNVSLKMVTTTDLADASVQAGVDTNTRSGSLPGSTLTGETAVLINLRIARRYRGGHPRIYLPLGESGKLQDAQHWTGTWQNTVNTGFTALVNAMLNLSSPDIAATSLANVSYVHNGAPRIPPLVDPVLGFSVNPIPGSQRRRMGR